MPEMLFQSGAIASFYEYPYFQRVLALPSSENKITPNPYAVFLPISGYC